MSYPRISPIHSELEKLNPNWGELFRMQVALRFGSLDEEKQRLSDLALCDLSALPKLGLKGTGCEEWLRNKKVVIPRQLYEHEEIEGDGLVIRTDRNEFFLEEGMNGEAVGQLSSSLGLGSGGCYRVERQDTGLLLAGQRASDVLRQTCSYPFSGDEKQLVMTRVALVSCAILPTRIFGVPAFRIWFIPSYGIYLWQNLLQIARELGGGAIGIECLRQV